VGHQDTETKNVARLTDKQRQCLHLVVLRKSSKQIARELGISKPTVDQRIANARQILGVGSRDEAALIFARHSGTYDRVIYDPAYVPVSETNDDSGFQEVRPEASLTLNEASVPYSGVFEHQTFRRQGFRWSPSGNFDTTTRVSIIVGLTVGILATVLIGLSVAQSISGLLTAS
jgi:DNA-binding CsgD family transcriptional regulator